MGHSILQHCVPDAAGTSERVSLFLVEGRRSEVAAHGGSAAEGEDIQVEIVPLVDALAMVVQGEIVDAKTIVALQHLALIKAGQIGQ